MREEVERLGYELFELRQGGSKSRPVLDVRIDRRDGAKVTVEDCAKASRAIEARLDPPREAVDGDGGQQGTGDVSRGDAQGAVPARYVLEVSSPGVERPLRNVADWRKYVGRTASVKAVPLPGGRAEVEIVGIEEGPSGDVAVVKTSTGAEHRLPLAAVTEARLAFTWQR